MKLLQYARRGEWATVAGYGLFVALMTGGYYYNVTFVQLGLLDLGTRLVGLSRTATAGAMAALALLSVAVAIAVGVTLDRRGWSSDLYAKLRVLLAVVVLQLLLTAAAPHVATVPAFAAWVVGCSLSIGTGLPVAFALAVDLVPVPDRGAVAAAVAGLSFALAAVYPAEWAVGSFSLVLTLAMLPAVPVSPFSRPAASTSWTDSQSNTRNGRSASGGSVATAR